MIGSVGFCSIATQAKIFTATQREEILREKKCAVFFTILIPRMGFKERKPSCKLCLLSLHYKLFKKA
jgi:hypothetical protein